MAKEPRRLHSVGFVGPAGEPVAVEAGGRRDVVVGSVDVIVTVTASTRPMVAGSAAEAEAEAEAWRWRWRTGGVWSSPGEKKKEEEEGRLDAATAVKVGTATSGNAGTVTAVGDRSAANIYSWKLLLLLKLVDIESKKSVPFRFRSCS